MHILAYVACKFDAVSICENEIQFFALFILFTHIGSINEYILFDVISLFLYVTWSSTYTTVFALTFLHQVKAHSVGLNQDLAVHLLSQVVATFNIFAFQHRVLISLA